MDLGCGNARVGVWLSKQKPNIEYVGIDISSEMLKIAQKNLPQGNFIQTPSSTLPFEDESFDAIISIALFHHLPPQEMKKTTNEVYRVLKPDRFFILTVWNTLVPRFWKEHLLSLWGAIKGKNRLGELKIGFKDPEKGTKIERYVRVLTLGHLKKLLLTKGFIIEESGYKGKNRRNLWIVARKPKKYL